VNSPDNDGPESLMRVEVELGTTLNLLETLGGQLTVHSYSRVVRSVFDIFFAQS